MENTQKHKQCYPLIIKEESNLHKLKYIFYWQSNPNPFNPQEIQTWDDYDITNQNHHNLNYELFLKDSKNFSFPLIFPSDNYNVDFQKMKQVNITFKIRPIKVERLVKETPKSDNKKIDEDFRFFGRQI